MRVNYKPELSSISKTAFPVCFATKCEGCKHYYKFERMWTYVADREWYNFVCIRCANNKTQVASIRDKYEKKNRSYMNEKTISFYDENTL